MLGFFSSPCAVHHCDHEPKSALCLPAHVLDVCGLRSVLLGRNHSQCGHNDRDCDDVDNLNDQIIGCSHDGSDDNNSQMIQSSSTSALERLR